MAPPVPCEFLEWDSDFFGCRIARLIAARLDAETHEHVRSWCQFHRIDCIYFLADPDDAESVRTAEDNGFRFVDIRITLAYEAGEGMPLGSERSLETNGIRPSRPEDVPGLRAIAGASHRSTRFYHDPHF